MQNYKNQLKNTNILCNFLFLFNKSIIGPLIIRELRIKVSLTKR